MPTPTSHASTMTSPISYTTYTTSHASSKFSTPTLIPSMFPWGPAFSCTPKSAQPSNFPIDRPTGSSAACVISNARDVNDHAFWDLYACCKGGDMTAIGDACTGMCMPGNGMTGKELGECLSKRVDVVVCKAAKGEVGSSVVGSSTGSSAAGSATRSATGSVSGSATASVSGSASPSLSTGGASAVGVGHVGGSKAGVVLFAVLAIGSFAGMML